MCGRGGCGPRGVAAAGRKTATPRRLLRPLGEATLSPQGARASAAPGGAAPSQPWPGCRGSGRRPERRCGRRAPGRAGQGRKPPACGVGGRVGGWCRPSEGSGHGPVFESPLRPTVRRPTASPEWHNNGFHLVGLRSGGEGPCKALSSQTAANCEAGALAAPPPPSPSSPAAGWQLETALCAGTRGGSGAPDPSEGLLLRVKSCSARALPCTRSLAPYSGPLKHCRLSA